MLMGAEALIRARGVTAILIEFAPKLLMANGGRLLAAGRARCRVVCMLFCCSAAVLSACCFAAVWVRMQNHS